jgi:homoserine kinase type II
MDVAGALHAVLSRYPAALEPRGALESLGGAGGLSGARLWRFHASGGRFAARLWPLEGPARAGLERIHGWIAEAAVTGIVPIPLPARDGSTVQEHVGRLWELVPWMPGVPEKSESPSAARRASALRALAAFHQSLAHHAIQGLSLGLERRCNELHALAETSARNLARSLAPFRSDPLFDLAMRWLDRAVQCAPATLASMRHAATQSVALQPCLRDLRPDHLLFEGDRLTALVDFGAMDFESVAADLARLLLEWIGPDRTQWGDAIAVYSSHRPLSPFEIVLIDLFARSAAVLGGGRWVRWHFLEGRTFNDPEAVREGLGRCLTRLEDLPEAL